MRKSLKIYFTISALLGLYYLGDALYVAYYGNFEGTNPALFWLLLISFGLVVYYVGKGVRFVWKMKLIVVLFALESCSYAKSNQQVVVSTDCGMSWKKIEAGDAVPKAGMNYCYMKVVIPNYPMQGESKFISNLKDKVRANITIDYDYSIIEALSFIKQAKYIGKANANADDPDAINEAAFEQAENMVIDKRIKDVAKDILIGQDIVDLDQSDLESMLLAECNKVLEPLGVKLNFITLTFDLDEQTRQAIDVSTAMKIYQSKGLEQLGAQVISQRAGATKVTVENRVEPPSVSQE